MQQFIIGTLLVIIIVIGGWLIYYYNKMANRKIMVDDSWDQLNFNLQKRNSLLQEYIEKILSLTTLQINNESIKITSTPGRLLNWLFTHSDLYTELKNDANFLVLEHQLKELEEKLQVCRYIYDNAMTSYNKSITTFPGNVSGLLLGLTELPYYVKGEREDGGADPESHSYPY